MANDKSLVSFAIMSMEWANNQRDYIDMLVPFTLYALNENQNENKIISVKQTKEFLLNEFGMKLPNNVIDIILRRLANSRYGYVKIFNNVFYYTDKDIELSKFNDNRVQVRQHQALVLEALRTYINTIYKDFKYENSELERKLIAYLSKYGISVLCKEDIAIILGENEDNIYNYYIGKFVQFAQAQNTTIFNYIKEIVKGAMLASAVYMHLDVKNIRINQDFDNLTIFLDTPLLMHILGYSGEAFQESCSELVKLLQNLGAKTSYFYHNIEELQDILDAYIEHYNKGTLDNSYNFDYMIQAKVTATQATMFRAKIQSDLSGQGIKLVDDPTITPENNTVDWTKAEEYLKENIYYKNPSKRFNDIKAICNIYILRKRNDLRRIENCQAIFATSNIKLANIMKNYFHNDEARIDYPPIIDDIFLTGIAWLKSSASTDELPTLRIISDALAAQMPNKDFWQEFINIVNSMRDEEKISEESLYELKYNAFVKSNIYEVSSGDIHKISHDTIFSILEKAKENEHSELIREKERIESAHMEEHRELIKEKATNLSRGIYIWKFTSFISKFLPYVGNFIIVLLTFIVSGILDSDNIAKWGGIGVASFIFINLILKVFENFLNDKLIKIRMNILEISKKQLIQKIRNKDDKYQSEIIDYITENTKYFRVSENNKSNPKAETDITLN